jgi:hypothetical protein
MSKKAGKPSAELGAAIAVAKAGAEVAKAAAKKPAAPKPKPKPKTSTSGKMTDTCAQAAAVALAYANPDRATIRVASEFDDEETMIARCRAAPEVSLQSAASTPPSMFVAGSAVAMINPDMLRHLEILHGPDGNPFVTEFVSPNNGTPSTDFFFDEGSADNNVGYQQINILGTQVNTLSSELCYAATVDGDEESQRLVWMGKGTLDIDLASDAASCEVALLFSYFDGVTFNKSYAKVSGVLTLTGKTRQFRPTEVKMLSDGTKTWQPLWLPFFASAKVLTREEMEKRLATCAHRTTRERLVRWLSRPPGLDPLTLELTITERGWYGVSMSYSASGGDGDLDMSFTHTALTTEVRYVSYPVQSLRYVNNALESWRAVGCASNVSNATPMLTAGGFVCGVVVPPGMNWLGLIGGVSNNGPTLSGADAVALVNALARAHRMDARSGIYGFVKPTSSLSVAYQQTFESQQSIVTQSYGALKNQYNESLLVAITVPVSSGSAPPVFAMDSRLNVEAVSLDPTREQRLPTCSTDEFRRGLDIVKHMDQWHENPKHEPQILKQIAGTVRGIGQDTRATFDEIGHTVDSFKSMLSKF